jgi:hypothetical protein
MLRSLTGHQWTAPGLYIPDTPRDYYRDPHRVSKTTMECIATFGTVTITPPGQGRGEKQNCRGGLVFWQDNENYLSFTAYLDDGYRGASIALFTGTAEGSTTLLDDGVGTRSRPVSLSGCASHATATTSSFFSTQPFFSAASRSHPSIRTHRARWIGGQLGWGNGTARGSIVHGAR